MDGIHDRMPVILHPDTFDVWLDPDNDEIPELTSLAARRHRTAPSPTIRSARAWATCATTTPTSWHPSRNADAPQAPTLFDTSTMRTSRPPARPVKLKLDLHDIYNRGGDIDRALRAIIDEAVDKKVRTVEIIPGKGSGQLKKRVLRFLDQKEIKALYDRVEKDSHNFGRVFVHFRPK